MQKKVLFSFLSVFVAVMALFFLSASVLAIYDVCEYGDECDIPGKEDPPYCYNTYCDEAEDCTAGCYTVYEDCDDDPYTPLEAYKRCVYTQDNPGQGGYQCTDWCPWGECTWDEMGQDYFQTRFCVL